MTAARRTNPMTVAYDKSIRALNLGPVDAAAIAAGRRLAQHIDETTHGGDPALISKALYMVPHLMHILDSLGATPAARDEIIGHVKPPAPPAPAAKHEPRVSSLQEFKNEHGIR
jgi:hypothetical protein